MSLDIYLFRVINNLADQSKFLDFSGVFLADKLAYILVLAAFVIIMLEPNWRQRFFRLFFISFSVLVARGFMVEIIRWVYARPRPSLFLSDVAVLIHKNLQEPSFPSGHAAAFFALAIAFYFVEKKWFPYFLTAAILMGIARVFVGVHYPLDILVGALIGWLGVLLARALIKRGA